MNSKSKSEEMKEYFKPQTPNFSIGDPVFFRPNQDYCGFKKGETYIGKVVQKSAFQDQNFPIRVKFTNTCCATFTCKGQFSENGTVELFFDQQGYEEEMEKSVDDINPINKTLNELFGFERTVFQIGKHVVWKIKKENRLGTVVQHNPASKYPILVDFGEGNIRTFTEDGKYSMFNDPSLFLKEDEDYEIDAISDSTYDHVAAPHYRKSPIEAIDIIERVYGADKAADWCEITAFKYRLRLGYKPTSPIEDDLKKEKWYLEKSVELRNKIPQPVN